ncbi:gluconokinase [Aeromicrobium sp. 636]|uniref:Gluconokinase n=1 Tax=Aeromicrobium senzhongii TaxID=2663859 RepID=A0A8I0ET92_9ACTN|nr:MULTISPECIES: gluconokinase [Aeromicrobium]MBC9225139.1 gluconokinase [Aeromicrobium senzhongii]MCQ3997249.1 gluconokinase [Aeromicrobium sp. 636]
MKPVLVVVMGISGVGKSVVGHAVADRAGVPYADGDDYHPKANIEKMSAGQALTDEDRWPWLELIGQWLADHDATGGVVSCSALRRVYREVLTQHAPRTVFLHLVGDHALIQSRMEARDHFMPVSLLESQEATLEPLEADENGVVFDVTETPDRIAAAFLVWLRSQEDLHE